MDNSLCLSASDKWSLHENKKLMTTKELANALGVSNMAIKRVLDKSDNLNGTVKVVNGKATVFTEEQAMLIKQELQKHHNLETRQIDNVTLEVEVMKNAMMAFEALRDLYVHKENELNNIIESQKEEIAELTPDAESWRKFAESDGTFSATNVAKCLGIKRDDLLKWLEVKHYIMRTRSDNPNKKGKYQGTAQGIEYGYIKNYVYTNDNISCIQFHLTPKGMQKVQKAFSEYKSGVDYVKKAMENTPELKNDVLFRHNNILGLKAE